LSASKSTTPADGTSIVGQPRRACALAVLDPHGRPQFLHLLVIDMRLAHEVCEGIGNRVQLALKRLVAPPLRVLKHCHQHHDDDRHGRRAGSQPRVRETSDDPQRDPGQDTGKASGKERPSTHGMHGGRGHLVESLSLAIDLAWRECARSALLEFLVLIHEVTPTRRFLGRNSITRSELRKDRRVAHPLSLSEPLSDDMDDELADIVADRSATSPVDAAAAALLPGEVAKLLAWLQPANADPHPALRARPW
jgi:hypothetical protein